MADASAPPSAWSIAKPFVNGGLAGMMATTIIQPIDMVKVRLQLGAKGSPFKVAGDIIKSDGAVHCDFIRFTVTLVAISRGSRRSCKL